MFLIAGALVFLGAMAIVCTMWASELRAREERKRNAQAAWVRRCKEPDSPRVRVTS